MPSLTNIPMDVPKVQGPREILNNDLLTYSHKYEKITANLKQFSRTAHILKHIT